METTEHASPMISSEDAKDYAKDGFWQYELAKAAFFQHVNPKAQEFPDLRGKSFKITVHEDGLHVTVEEA